MDLYRQEILDHYKNPHNFGRLAKADLSFEEFNPLCGDRILLQLAVRNARVAEAKFVGEGCAVSTAAASILTDYLKGKKITEIKSLNPAEVLTILGLTGISASRLKCALLAWAAAQGALGVD